MFLTLACFLLFVIHLLMLCRKIAHVADVYCYIETDFKFSVFCIVLDAKYVP